MSQTEVKAQSVATPSSAQNQSKSKPAPVVKKPSISGLGISISALSQKTEEVEKVNTAIQEDLTETFTPIQLLNSWKAYAETLVEEHHLKNTMINCLPSLLNRDTFEVVVNNPVQEQRLLDNAVSILSILRKELRNTHILMKVRISIDNEKKLGYTSLEKFNLMQQENENLKKLKDEFGLELL